AATRDARDPIAVLGNELKARAVSVKHVARTGDDGAARTGEAACGMRQPLEPRIDRAARRDWRRRINVLVERAAAADDFADSISVLRTHPQRQRGAVRHAARVRIDRATLAGRCRDGVLLRRE